MKEFGLEYFQPFLECSAPGLCLVGGLALGIDSWTPNLPGPYHTVAPSRSGHHKVSGTGMESQSAAFLRNEQRKRHQFFDPAAINPHVRPSPSQTMMLWELNKVARDLVHISWKQGFPSTRNGYIHDLLPATVTVMAGSPATLKLGL